MSIQESKQSENHQLTIGDVYEGDSLDTLIPTAIEIKSSQNGPLCVLSAVDDPENVLWIQSSVSFKLEECL